MHLQLFAVKSLTCIVSLAMLAACLLAVGERQKPMNLHGILVRGL